MSHTIIMTPEQERLIACLPELDDINLSALLVSAKALLRGETYEQAIEESNKILEANGRTPIDPATVIGNMKGATP